MDKIPCRDLSNSGLAPFELFHLNLSDNLATRQFNDVEKAMILVRLASHITFEEILDHYMAVLDLPSHKETLLSFINIEKGLENEIKEYLARGYLSLLAAKLLLDLNSNARHRVFNLINKLKLNINQQRFLLDFLNDISYRQKRTIPEVLGEKTIEAICSDRQLNNPQKSKALLEFLRSMLLPSVVKAEKTFRKEVARLNLPSGVKLSAPRFFEGPHYRLEVSFRGGEELKNKIERLSRTKGLQDLSDPWDREI